MPCRTAQLLTAGHLPCHRPCLLCSNRRSASAPPAASARPQVRSLLRQRDAGWKEAEAQSAASPVVPLPHKVVGGEEPEDWRAVLDKKAAAAGTAAAGQDSARGAPAQEPEAAPAEAAVGAEQQQEAAAPAEQQASSEAQKQQALQQLVAAAPASVPWDVAALAQAVQADPALDLAAPADAQRLAGALLDHAAASAAASGSGEAEPLRELPAAVTGCAALVAELAAQAPAVGEAAAAHLAAAFRKRGEARSREARAQLGQQMLLAGSLAQRGVLPEAQLQTMLEQLARQVGKRWGHCAGCWWVGDWSALRSEGAAGRRASGAGGRGVSLRSTQVQRSAFTTACQHTRLLP